MVRNVGKIDAVNFRAVPVTQGNRTEYVSYPQIKELPNVTPDFAVVTPQKYTKRGVIKLPNGLEIHSYKLANGYKVSVIPMEGSPAVVKNYVNVGSLNETQNIKGISHFLEHMAFNGTNGENGHMKLEVGDSFKKIDALGGWANASTNYAITDYVNAVPLFNENDVAQQIKVIGAMTEDLKLSNEMIAKEKGPVCSEINMILDNPETIAMDQTVRTLFNIKNPTDELVGGSVESIKNLTREDVKNYYDKYYTPDNMNLVITGDVNPDNVMQIVAKTFNSTKNYAGRKFEEPMEVIQQTVRKDFVSDKAKSTNIVIGFAGPQNNDAREKVLYDLAKLYLKTSQVGLKQKLKKLSASLDISSEKISTRPTANRMIYIASDVSESNSEEALKTIFDTIGKIKPIDDTYLQITKNKLKQARETALEYSSAVNDYVGKSVLDNNIEYLSEYDNILNSITKEEFNEALKKYFDINKAAITVVHPNKDSQIAFKGKKAMPLDMSKVNHLTLDNNYEVGLVETKSGNTYYDISLNTKIPYTKCPAAPALLDLIYTMGTSSMDEKEWTKFKEKNNLSMTTVADSNGITVSGITNNENTDLLIKSSISQLLNPSINEDNLKLAKLYLKDILTRIQDSAVSLYSEEESNNNPYEFTKDEILKSIDTVTIDDIKDYQKYILTNAHGTVTANLPAENTAEFKNKILNYTNKLPKVKPMDNSLLELYAKNNKPKVLTKENNNSQAEVAQIYKFESNRSIKESLAGQIMNSILTSSSIGLFDVLREKEHLAYSVHSEINRSGNRGELYCHILTTTDNKNIGEISYDNVEKSIKGFSRQINALKSGEFTETDLNNAKMSIKAGLIENEGVSGKLSTLYSGINSPYGPDYYNKLFKEIDNITKEDIIEFAKKVFNDPPTYAIVASQDTLKNNENFLKSLSM